MILGIVAILTIVNTFYIHHLCNLVYEELDKKDKVINNLIGGRNNGNN